MMPSAINLQIVISKWEKRRGTGGGGRQRSREIGVQLVKIHKDSVSIRDVI